VTKAGFGFKIKFLAHLELIITIDYSGDPNSHTLFLTIAHIKSSMSSVVYWSEFLATDPEVPGSIPDASRFSEKQRVWNGVHSAS
jgi:hypothetical protein